jgi:hypothetical protein
MSMKDSLGNRQNKKSLFAAKKLKLPSKNALIVPEHDNDGNDSEPNNNIRPNMSLLADYAQARTT